MILYYSIIQKKESVGSLSVTVLRTEASRIALSKLDGNAEAHACICKILSYPADAIYRVPTGRHSFTHPRASTVAQSLT